MNSKGLVGSFLMLAAFVASAQTFDLLDQTDSYSAGLSQTIKIPIRIKNTTDKAQFYIVRLVESELSGTQKGYFCIDKICHEAGVTEFSKRIEAGATLEGLYYTLETGLVSGRYPFKFEVFPKGNVQASLQRSVNVNVEEKQNKSLVFQSKDITIQDVYPNPVVDQAYIDYRLHSETVKAKLVVHNILGSSISTIDLNFTDSRAKIQAEDLIPGVYFYTVYLDNIGVLTRKLIVRR